MSEDQTHNLNPSEPVTLESLAAQMAQMMAEFREFRAFAEPKLYDTKPIWEKALAEIMEMSQRLARVEKELRQVNRRLDVISVDLIETREQVREIEDKQSPQH